MKFKAKVGSPRVAHHSLARTIVFRDGEYETTDKAEVAILKADHRVEVVKEKAADKDKADKPKRGRPRKAEAEAKDGEEK
jgi:hypothetical protein